MNVVGSDRNGRAIKKNYDLLIIKTNKGVHESHVQKMGKFTSDF